MNNVFTQSVTNNDFFPRDKIINRLYRYLDDGNHMLIAAPRRVGKTSIMWYMRDNPKENYRFVYVFLEPINSIEKYYERLIEELSKSDALSTLIKKSSKVKELVKNTIGRIKGIELLGLAGIELSDQKPISHQKAFEQLMEKLDTDDHRIVFLLDEYPQAIENIKSRHGVEVAKEFLQQCRAHRHSANRNVLYTYTGSIGLPAVVKGITSSNVINDIGTIEVGPLRFEEAKEMATKILSNCEVDFEPAAIDNLLKGFDWLIPFHIQLAMKEMVELYEEEERRITIEDITDINARILNFRNNRYFKQYYDRLEKAFEKSVHKAVLNLLNYIAINQPVDQAEMLNKFSRKMKNDDYDRVIESLQFDGYIVMNENTNQFKFTSELIRKWWVKFIVKK